MCVLALGQHNVMCCISSNKHWILCWYNSAYKTNISVLNYNYLNYHSVQKTFIEENIVIVINLKNSITFYVNIIKAVYNQVCLNLSIVLNMCFILRICVYIWEFVSLFIYKYTCKTAFNTFFVIYHDIAFCWWLANLFIKRKV